MNMKNVFTKRKRIKKLLKKSFQFCIKKASIPQQHLRIVKMYFYLFLYLYSLPLEYVLTIRYLLKVFLSCCEKQKTST